MKILICICLALPIMAQQQVELWPDNPPDQRQSDETEHQSRNAHLLWIQNVQQPTLEVYVPANGNATGEAILIFPGGGYHGLAYDWEGTDVAKWCNANGVAGLVVKYRLPVSPSLTKPHLAPLQDAQRAMRLARQMADSLGWTKIGVMGFSAGGHLASTLSTRYDYPCYSARDEADKHSAKPDFSILVYPVITFGEKRHSGSMHALIGEEPTEDQRRFFSNELHVNSATPPTILIHAADDEGVPMENSMKYFQALKDASVYSELHIYPFGGHGFSFAHEKGYLSQWPDQVMEFVKTLPK